jgi:FAD/FMN-containing dehydrogenase
MLTARPLATDVATLRAQLEGTIVLPGEESWDQARQAWNLAIDQRPALVALPRSSRDVQLLVEHARETGLRVAMQGTGHNAGPLGGAALEQTMLVRTSEMRELHIDAEARVARVGAGVLWAEVTRPASELGLAPLAGSSPDVGVVGYTLGGGLSWLGRRYGLAAERILAVEIVTADGRLVRADRTTEADLFWAIQGGGGSFGAVTAMEFELIPLREVYAGMLLWPLDRAEEVVHAWREWTATAPDAVTTALRIVHMPPMPELPDFLRGRSIVVVDGAVVGDEASAHAIMAPLRALEPEIDTFAMIPPAGLSHIHMDPEHPVPGLSSTAMLDALPVEAADTFVDLGRPGRALMMVELRHVGGALSRPGTGALRRLDGQYVMFALGVPMDPAMVPAIEAHLALAAAAMTPYGHGRGYANFSETPKDPAAFFGADAYARLRRIKAEVDPGDVFQGNHPIAPAS